MTMGKKIWTNPQLEVLDIRMTMKGFEPKKPSGSGSGSNGGSGSGKGSGSDSFGFGS